MNKRNKHNVNSKASFKGNVPKNPVEWLTSPEGHLYSPHKVSIVKGNGVYHPRKGWRVVQEYTPHTVLHSLFKNIGIDIYESSAYN